MGYTIYYIAGLPRSGSTLLTNILSQNKDFKVTPTNNLIGLILNVKNTWTEMEGFKAQGLENVKGSICTTMQYMLHGYHEKALNEGKIVFDKSRGWLNCIELLEYITGKKVKIITPIRDVKDICASFERLSRQNNIVKSKLFSSDLAAMNTNSRTNDLLSLHGVVGSSISALRDAMQRKLTDRLVVVPFDNLTNKPKETLDEIHKSLKLKPFKYDFKNVKNLTKENDLVYGLEGLHETKKVVKPVKSNALDILGYDLCKEIDTKHNDINQLIKL